MTRCIATWLMAENGIKKAKDLLDEGKDSAKALLAIIQDVESDERFVSVGRGGLPNREGKVQLDGAFMDGDDLKFGAVMAIEDIASPIEVAYSLKDRDANNILVAKGAKAYALKKGFKEVDNLTKKAKERYLKKCQEDPLKAYDGHDTIGAIVIDEDGHMVAGTSTSGLFYKDDGRVGDSPLIGSGLYVDSEVGGATATGMGEDIAKGCVSFKIVDLMRNGKSVKEATKIAVLDFIARLKRSDIEARDISVVALKKDGSFAAYSNIPNFTFCIDDEKGVKVYRLELDQNGDQVYIEVDDAFKSDWLSKE